MSESADAGNLLRSIGESVGGLLAGIPPAIGDFFGGIGAGAGLDGILDWTFMIIGIALLVSAIRGLTRARIVLPILRGVIGIAFMAWSVT